MTAVTYRPILMMDRLVLRTLADRKTVTRRVGASWARCQPGDRLWVREAHAIVDGRAWSGLPCAAGPDWRWAYYRAGFDRTAPRWRPSIHMPRWACRLYLEVVSVTVENPFFPLLIDKAEAEREGFDSPDEFGAAWFAMHPAWAGPVYRIEFRRVAEVTP